MALLFFEKKKGSVRVRVFRNEKVRRKMALLFGKKKSSRGRIPVTLTLGVTLTLTLISMP